MFCGYLTKKMNSLHVVVVPKFSQNCATFISILFGILLIFSHFCTECECQEEAQELSTPVDSSSSSSDNTQDYKTGASNYVPRSNPYSNQESYNYNPNYYNYNQDDYGETPFSIPQYPQTSVDPQTIGTYNNNSLVGKLGHYSPILEWPASQNEDNNNNKYLQNYVNIPQNYYGYTYTSLDKNPDKLHSKFHTPTPTQIQQVKMRIHNALQRHRRVEDGEAHGLGLDWGRAMSETLFTSALFPVTFFAFAMIFMDIMGRLVPVRIPSLRSVFGSQSTTTTTTTRPPKITRIEIQPPGVPDIAGLLGGVKDQINKIKELHGDKKGHYDSDEYGWGGWRSDLKRRRSPFKRLKKKRRNKGKKKGGMTWKKLQKLYATYKPTVL